MAIMRVATLACLLLAFLLALFAYWGINTPGGQHAFDEMAGMIPFGAGLLSGALVLVAVGVELWSRRR